jgi:competence protein ComEA
MRIQRLSNLALAGACALALVTTRAAALDTGPVNLNTASEKELQALPGVGEATAKKIVAGRPYSSVDDLAKAGVSQSTISKLRSSVTVGGAAAAPAPPAASKSSKSGAAPAPAAASKSSKSSAAPATPAVAPVDLNTASLKDLEELPGVGEATAKKIVAGRPYSSVDDLAKAGVSKSTIEKLRSSATVSGAAAAPAAASKSSKSSAAPATPTAAPVDLNTASLKDLEELPGVGEATAKKIVAGRPYSSVDDLAKAGVSKSTIEKLRPAATVSGAAAARAPASAPGPASSASASASASAPAPSTPAPSAAPAAASPAATSSATAKPTTAAPAGAAGTPGKVAVGEKVNINTASKEDLERLPGIGPTKAQAIIDARPFTAPTDIMKVKGIKEATFAKLKDNITVN